MYRCATVAAALVWAALPADAQIVRNFPATALRGEIVLTQPPELLLNGRPARLAPGARIRGMDNMLQMSGALVGQPRLVHFTLDAAGQLHDVWLLTPAEAQRRPWPATPAQAASWRFDPGSQTWSRP